MRLGELKKYSNTGYDYPRNPRDLDDKKFFNLVDKDEPWRGPHESRELEMMLDGIKPAAIISLSHIKPWIPHIKSGKFKVKRMSPFEVTRNVDALLAQEKGELLIKVDPVILPKGFNPDIIALDSLTAIASAFTGKEDSYRIYIEQLFRFFENIGSTAFLITETKQIPEIFSTTGVEEFLADGVIVFYNIKRGDVRENAIEVLKMRSSKHQKKIVAMQISSEGITVYPEQEIFGGLGNE